MALLDQIISAVLTLGNWIAAGKPCEEPTRFCLISQIIVFIMRIIVVSLMYLAIRDLLSSGLVSLYSGIAITWLVR